MRYLVLEQVIYFSLSNMPRRRPQQPPTPENLPPIPTGAIKKAYYPHPDTVYYLQDRKLLHLLVYGPYAH